MSKAFFGSRPNAFAMSIILSGLKVFSVSMNIDFPPRPPFSFGNCTVTASWWASWDFPEPYAPWASIIDWVSTPPPIRASRDLLPVVILPTDPLFFITSVAGSKPIFMLSLAAAMILLAVSSPTPAAVISSPEEAAAIAIKSS